MASAIEEYSCQKEALVHVLHTLLHNPAQESDHRYLMSLAAPAGIKSQAAAVAASFLAA